MSGLFNALLVRCTRAAFASREDIIQCTISLLELCKCERQLESVKKYTAPIKRFARRDAKILSDATTNVMLDGGDKSSACYAVLLSQTLLENTSSSEALNVIWCKLIESTQTALLSETWSLQHLRVIMYNVTKLQQSSNRLPREFFAAFGQFIEAKIETTCSALSTKSPLSSSSSQEETFQHTRDLSLLISMTTLLPEVERNSALHYIANRTAALADVLPINTLGHICAVFNEFSKQNDLLVVAMQEEADRIANDGDVFAVVHVFRFIGAHKEEVLSTEALQWLMERLTSEEFDVETILHMCSVLGHLPESILRSVAGEWIELITTLCGQITEIFIELCEDAENSVCNVNSSSNCQINNLTTDVNRVKMTEKMLETNNNNNVHDSVDVNNKVVSHHIMSLTEQIIELWKPLHFVLEIERERELDKLKHDKEKEVSYSSNNEYKEQHQEEQAYYREEVQEKEKEKLLIKHNNISSSPERESNLETEVTSESSANEVMTNESHHISLTYPSNYTQAVEKCLKSIQVNCDKFIELDETLVHSFIMKLLESSKINILASLMSGAITLLRLLSAQVVCSTMTSLRVFQYMTFLYDKPYFGNCVICVNFIKYLSKSVHEMSIMQLCAVLKCFAEAIENAKMKSNKTERNEKDHILYKPSLSSTNNSDSDASFIEDNNQIDKSEFVNNDTNEMLISQELIEIELAPFLQLCAESVTQHCSEGVSIRCMLMIIACMHRLGYKDVDFYALCSKYLTLKVKAGATASDYCQYTVEIVRNALCSHEDLLDTTLNEFFNEISQTESITENNYDSNKNHVDELNMSPHEWLKKYDLNFSTISRSEESLQCCMLLDSMNNMSSEERDKVCELAHKYIEQMSNALPCDHVKFFNIFATKLLKQDNVLKKCMEKLIDLHLVCTLSGADIASILNSLATIKYIYVGTLKSFLNAMKVEQWNEMEVTDIVRTLDAFSRLGFRFPAIINNATRQLTELAIFLSPFQLASTVYALQGIGCASQSVIQLLMEQASKNAKRFDEVSISTLFNVPSFHRLIHSPEVATPLLHQACAKISSAQRRRRIARFLRQSSLPRTLIESQTSRLLAIADNSVHSPTLLLQDGNK